MRISVITVCYNAQDYIEKTILSVVNQTYTDYEYIIVDGNSTDSTKTIIRKYLNHISVFISERDKGIYDAMNKGIKLSTGDYIVFLNAGDTFHNSKVLSDIAKKDMASDIVCGSVNIMFRGEEHIYNPGNLKDTNKYMPIPHPGMFIRGSYHKSCLYDISYKSSGDYDFVYRSFYKNKATFQFVDVVVSNYDNEGGMSKDNYKRVKIENLRIQGLEATPYRMLVINIDSLLWNLLITFKKYSPVWLLKFIHKIR